MSLMSLAESYSSPEYKALLKMYTVLTLAEVKEWAEQVGVERLKGESEPTYRSRVMYALKVKLSELTGEILSPKFYENMARTQSLAEYEVKEFTDKPEEPKVEKSVGSRPLESIPGWLRELVVKGIVKTREDIKLEVESRGGRPGYFHALAYRVKQHFPGFGEGAGA